MQVNKAHVAAPNCPTEDFLEARLSDPCTLKRAGTNSAQLKEFFFFFSKSYHFCNTFSDFWRVNMTFSRERNTKQGS